MQATVFQGLIVEKHHCLPQQVREFLTTAENSTADGTQEVAPEVVPFYVLPASGVNPAIVEGSIPCPALWVDQDDALATGQASLHLVYRLGAAPQVCELPYKPITLQRAETLQPTDSRSRATFHAYVSSKAFVQLYRLAISLFPKLEKLHEEIISSEIHVVHPTDHSDRPSTSLQQIRALPIDQGCLLEYHDAQTGVTSKLCVAINFAHACIELREASSSQYAAGSQCLRSISSLDEVLIALQSRGISGSLASTSSQQDVASIAANRQGNTAMEVSPSSLSQQQRSSRLQAFQSPAKPPMPALTGIESILQGIRLVNTCSSGVVREGTSILQAAAATPETAAAAVNAGAMQVLINAAASVLPSGVMGATEQLTMFTLCTTSLLDGAAGQPCRAPAHVVAALDHALRKSAANPLLLCKLAAALLQRPDVRFEAIKQGLANTITDAYLRKSPLLEPLAKALLAPIGMSPAASSINQRNAGTTGRQQRTGLDATAAQNDGMTGAIPVTRRVPPIGTTTTTSNNNAASTSSSPVKTTTAASPVTALDLSKLTTPIADNNTSSSRSQRLSMSWQASPSSSVGRINIPRLTLPAAQQDDSRVAPVLSPPGGGITPTGGGFTRATRRSAAFTPGSNNSRRAAPRSLTGTPRLLAGEHASASAELALLAEGLGESLMALDLPCLIAHKRDADDRTRLIQDTISVDVPSEDAGMTSEIFDLPVGGGYYGYAPTSTRQNTVTAHRILTTAESLYSVETDSSAGGQSGSGAGGPPSDGLQLSDPVEVKTLLLQALLVSLPIAGCGGNSIRRDPSPILAAEVLSIALDTEAPAQLRLQATALEVLVRLAHQAVVTGQAAKAANNQQEHNDGSSSSRSDRPHIFLTAAGSKLAHLLAKSGPRADSAAAELVPQLLVLISRYLDMAKSQCAADVFVESCNVGVTAAFDALHTAGRIEDWSVGAWELFHGLCNVLTPVASYCGDGKGGAAVISRVLCDGETAAFLTAVASTVLLQTNPRCALSSVKLLAVQRDLLRLFTAVAALVGRLDPMIKGSDASGDILIGSAPRLTRRQGLSFFTFLVAPGAGFVRRVLEHQDATQVGPALRLRQPVFEFLKAVLAAPGNPFITNKPTADYYVRFHFIQFLKLYHNPDKDHQAAFLCRQHLAMLLVFAKAGDAEGAAHVRPRFLQLSVMDFFVRELSLEFETKQPGRKRSRASAEVISHRRNASSASFSISNAPTPPEAIGSPVQSSQPGFGGGFSRDFALALPPGSLSRGNPATPFAASAHTGGHSSQQGEGALLGSGGGGIPLLKLPSRAPSTPVLLPSQQQQQGTSGGLNRVNSASHAAPKFSLNLGSVVPRGMPVAPGDVAGGSNSSGRSTPLSMRSGQSSGKHFDQQLGGGNSRGISPRPASRLNRVFPGPNDGNDGGSDMSLSHKKPMIPRLGLPADLPPASYSTQGPPSGAGTALPSARGHAPTSTLVAATGNVGSSDHSTTASLPTGFVFSGDLDADVELLEALENRSGDGSATDDSSSNGSSSSSASSSDDEQDAPPTTGPRPPFSGRKILPTLEVPPPPLAPDALDLTPDTEPTDAPLDSVGSQGPSLTTQLTGGTANTTAGAARPQSGSSASSSQQQNQRAAPPAEASLRRFSGSPSKLAGGRVRSAGGNSDASGSQPQRRQLQLSMAGGDEDVSPTKSSRRLSTTAESPIAAMSARSSLTGASDSSSSETELTATSQSDDDEEFEDGSSQVALPVVRSRTSSGIPKLPLTSSMHSTLEARCAAAELEVAIQAEQARRQAGRSYFGDLEKSALGKGKMQAATAHRGTTVAASEVAVNDSYREVSYSEERQWRALYRDDELHVEALVLVFTLILNKRGQLDPVYCDQYPWDRKLQNIPFILHHHLNHPENRSILPRLLPHLDALGPPALRFLRSLCAAFFRPSWYSSRARISGVAGAYATVYRCRLPDWCGAGSVVLKLLDTPKHIQDRCGQVDFHSEVTILETLAGNPRACKMYDYGLDPGADAMCLVLKDYRCSLKQWRARQPKDPSGQLRLYYAIFREVLVAAKTLLDVGVVHFDIKCDNFLLEPLPGTTLEDFWAPPSDVPTFRVVLADFGESKLFVDGSEGSATSRARGTDCFKSPEMLLVGGAVHKTHRTYDRRRRQGAGAASDVWSLGCLLYELVTGRLLFSDSDWLQLVARVTSAGMQLITDDKANVVSPLPGVYELLLCMLVRDPALRPTLRDVQDKLDAIVRAHALQLPPHTRSSAGPLPTDDIHQDNNSNTGTALNSGSHRIGSGDMSHLHFSDTLASLEPPLLLSTPLPFTPGLLLAPLDACRADVIRRENVHHVILLVLPSSVDGGGLLENDESISYVDHQEVLVRKARLPPLEEGSSGGLKPTDSSTLAAAAAATAQQQQQYSQQPPNSARRQISHSFAAMPLVNTASPSSTSSPVEDERRAADDGNNLPATRRTRVVPLPSSTFVGTSSTAAGLPSSSTWRHRSSTNAVHPAEAVPVVVPPSLYPGSGGGGSSTGYSPSSTDEYATTSNSPGGDSTGATIGGSSGPRSSPMMHVRQLLGWMSGRKNLGDGSNNGSRSSSSALKESSVVPIDSVFENDASFFSLEGGSIARQLKFDLSLMSTGSGTTKQQQQQVALSNAGGNNNTITGSLDGRQMQVALRNVFSSSRQQAAVAGVLYDEKLFAASEACLAAEAHCQILPCCSSSSSASEEYIESGGAPSSTSHQSDVLTWLESALATLIEHHQSSPDTVIMLATQPGCEGDMALLALAYHMHVAFTKERTSAASKDGGNKGGSGSTVEDQERMVGPIYLAAVHAAHWGVDSWLRARHIEALKTWTNSRSSQ